MRMYLDCCSLQRPFDDKSNPRIGVEAEAVLVILSLCESDQLKLLSSEALLFEINRIPDKVRKNDFLSVLKIAAEKVKLISKLETLAQKFVESGLTTLDALHLASGSISKADYFCTCDDKFLRKARSFKGLETKVVSPTELVMELDI